MIFVRQSKTNIRITRNNSVEVHFLPLSHLRSRISSRYVLNASVTTEKSQVEHFSKNFHRVTRQYQRDSLTQIQNRFQ